MLNLKAYSDELFRVDEVLQNRLNEWLVFDERYFYNQTDLNRPFLAHHFDLEQNLSDDEVKPLLNQPLKNHFLEGTFYSLSKALTAFFDDSFVSQWHEYGGEPYHFKLILQTSQKPINQTILKRADEIAMKFKNVRSVMDGVSVIITTKAKTTAGAYITQGESIEVYPFILREIDAKGGFVSASAIKQDEIININLDLREGIA